jgi:TRAP transporter TAXI family solute receptor
MMNNTPTRRETIKYLGGTAAITALAGCSGGGGGSSGGDSGGDDSGGDGGSGDGSGGGGTTQSGPEPEEFSTFRLISGPQNGVTFLMHNAAAGVLDRETDLGLDVVSGTSGESMSRLVGGQSELAFGTAKAGLDAVNRAGPFGQVDFAHDLYQVSTQTTLIEPVIVPTGSDYQTWSDLDGVSIATGPQGSTYQAYYREALDNIVGEGNYELVHQGVTEIAQEFSAGRVDAAGGPGIVSGLTPGFMQQMYSDNDIRLLGLSEESQSMIEEHPWLSVQTLPNSAFGDSIEEYTQESETTTVRVDYPHFSTDKVSADSIHNLLDALWNNRQSLIDAHPAWELFSEDSVWTGALNPDVPVHPGAVEFFKENDLWDDTLTEGSF